MTISAPAGASSVTGTNSGADLGYLQDVPDPDIERPHPSRLDPGRSDYDAIITAHELAVVGREPGYSDPTTGLFVLTVEYLRARGYCCNEGCRHCPYLDSAERP